MADSAAIFRQQSLTIVDDDWSLGVVDECHYLKNLATGANKLFQQLKKDSLLMMSATAMSNHVKDIEGYLSLAWNPAWPFVYQGKSEAISASSFYYPEAWEKVRKPSREFNAHIIGCYPGLDSPYILVNTFSIGYSDKSFTRQPTFITFTVRSNIRLANFPNVFLQIKQLQLRSRNHLPLPNTTKRAKWAGNIDFNISQVFEEV